MKLLTQDEVAKELRRSMKKASEACLAYAMVSQAGLEILMDDLEKFAARKGRLEFLIGFDLPTEPTALQWLLDLQQRNAKTVSVRMFEAPDDGAFHPKYAVFTGRSVNRAIIGSSNFTKGGFESNFEMNVLLEGKDIAAQLRSHFANHFSSGQSIPLSKSWLNTYRRVFKERKDAADKERRARSRIVSQMEAVPVDVPRQIAGHTWAFTGRLKTRRLYRTEIEHEVKDLGGMIAGDRYTVGRKAHCLVKAALPKNRKRTVKIRMMHSAGRPVISEERFFQILDLAKKRL